MAGDDLTLEASENGVKLRVVVRVLDAPGPSGYQSRRYRGEDTISSLPEIDAVALQSRRTLEDFLRGLMAVGGQEAEVICVKPRVTKLRRLLKAKPGAREIRVELGKADGSGEGS